MDTTAQVVEHCEDVAGEEEGINVAGDVVRGSRLRLPVRKLQSSTATAPSDSMKALAHVDDARSQAVAVMVVDIASCASGEVSYW